MLKEMFAKRKTLSFRHDIASELAAKKEVSLEFLRRNGVIRDNGEFVELEDVYLKFFEEVLEVNEKIVAFCCEMRLAFFDTARKVRRLKDNADDNFLEIVEGTDVFALLEQMPKCRTNGKRI